MVFWSHFAVTYFLRIRYFEWKKENVGIYFCGFHVSSKCFREQKIQFFYAKVNIYDSLKYTLNTYGKAISLLLREK